MFPFFSRRHRHTTGEIVLIFDIGSGSVGAALALISESHKPILLATERAELSFQDTLRAKQLQPLMLRALSRATLSLLAEGIPRAGLSARRLKVAGALFVLAAPWCSSRTKTLSLSQKEPLTITEQVIAELVRHSDGEREKVAETTDVAERKIPPVVTRFERLLLSARLNGYETEEPVGKVASTASFSFFESRAPRALLSAIGDTVEHFIHPRRARFHSYALSAISTLRELFPGAEDFLFLDIGGEMTEAVIVRKRALRGVFSFPRGRNHLIRALAEGAHSSPSVAAAILSLTREKNLHAGQEERTTALLHSFRDSWLGELNISTAQFSDEPILPSSVYLSVDTDCSEIFANFLREKVRESVSSEAVPTVSVLRGEFFRSHLAMSSPGAAADSFLMLETVYANQLRGGRTLFA